MSTATLTYAASEESRLKSTLIRLIERVTGARRLQRLYAKTAAVDDGAAFWDAALRQLRVRLDVDGTPLDALPPDGPLVVVANHPFGVLDGIALCHLISDVRPSFQILINSVLCRDPRLDAYFLPIDFRETREARRTNVRSIKTALATLSDDGAIVLFPAGGIATAPSPFGEAEDLEWKPFAAKLVQSAGATVVPIYFHGQNSRLFQLASQVSLTLRLSLIIREVTRRIGDTLRVTVGEPLSPERLDGFDDRRALTTFLREQTVSLAPRG